MQSGDSADLYSPAPKRTRLVARATQRPGMLERGEVDAYAANRMRLTEVAPTLPGSRVLPGRFLALAQTIAARPRGGAPYLNGFVARAKALARCSAIDRANVPGAVVALAPGTIGRTCRALGCSPHQ